MFFPGKGYFCGVGGFGVHMRKGEAVFPECGWFFFSLDFRIGFALECIVLLFMFVKASP